MYPIANIAETRTLESQVVESGIPVEALMELAGTELASTLNAWARVRQVATGPVLVLVGPGNNGGDGLICARRLHDAWERVYVYLWNRSDQEDSLIADLERRQVQIVHAEQDEGMFVLTRWLRHSSWCVDALLGTGANRPLPADLVAILDEVRGHRPRLRLCSADLPAGALSGTGADVAAFPADLTIMLGTFKSEVCRDGRLPNLGSIEVVDIGLFPEGSRDTDAQGLRAADLDWLLPRRSNYSHKGTFGRVLCAVGSGRFPGAAILAAAGVLRSGAGLVTVAGARPVLTGLAAGLPEATHLPLPDQDGTVEPGAAALVLKEVSRYESLLVGCGIGHTDASAAFLRELLIGLRAARPIPLVIDADGLNCLASEADWPSLLPEGTVLTPHLAEMARLCGLPVSEVAANSLELAEAKAQAWGCHVILKSHASFAAAPDGQVRVLVEPNSALATGGTGDVLAGLLAGLRTRVPDPLQASAAAMLVLSEAGRLSGTRLGPDSTLASDVLQDVPRVFAQHPH